MIHLVNYTQIVLIQALNRFWTPFSACDRSFLYPLSSTLCVGAPTVIAMQSMPWMGKYVRTKILFCYDVHPCSILHMFCPFHWTLWQGSVCIWTFLTSFLSHFWGRFHSLSASGLDVLAPLSSYVVQDIQKLKPTTYFHFLVLWNLWGCIWMFLTSFLIVLEHFVQVSPGSTFATYNILPLQSPFMPTTATNSHDKYQ